MVPTIWQDTVIPSAWRLRITVADQDRIAKNALKLRLTRRRCVQPAERFFVRPEDCSLVLPVERSLVPLAECSLVPLAECSLVPLAECSLVLPVECSLVPLAERSLVPVAERSLVPPTNPDSPYQQSSNHWYEVHQELQKPKRRAGHLILLRHIRERPVTAQPGIPTEDDCSFEISGGGWRPPEKLRSHPCAFISFLWEYLRSKCGKTFTRGPKLRSLARRFQDYNSYRPDQPVSSLLFHPFNEK